MTKKEDLIEALKSDPISEKVIENNEYISIVKVNKRTYHIYIQEDVGELEEYVKLFHILRTAKNTDKISISINSFGGYLHTAMQIYNAIKKSKAEITTILEHMAYSAGSMIFMAGHIKKVMPHSGMMIHNYYGEIEGKGNEMQLEIEFEKKSYERLFKSIYKYFLAEEEIQQMLDGKDFWLTDKEIKRRLRYPVT